jgi:putative ABC transport system permease protein
VNRFSQWFERSRIYDDVAQEIREHLLEKTAALVEAGMTPEAADLAARREFGSVTSIEEQSREAWGWRWLEDCASDLRFGARQLGRHPALALAAIVTLALGIGANTAIFTAVRTVLLRPLPFKESDRLVLVSEYKPGNVDKTGSPLLRYRERAAQSVVFEEVGGYWDVSGGNGMVFGTNQSAERLQFSIVTGSLFSLLGVQPAIGRSFAPEEELPGGARVFLASDGLYRRELGGDPHAIGKAFRLDGESYTLIGVLPPDFNFPLRCDVWIPVGVLGTSPLHDRVSHQFWMLGRLRPGITVSDAQTQLETIQQRLANVYPATDANWHVRVTGLLQNFVGDVRTALWVLMAAVAFVLLIACTNVVNLLLARAVARQKEFAVRTALGAGRGRLLRQALTETTLIVAAGTILALLLAELGMSAMIRLGAASIPRLDRPHLDAAVLAFSAALGVVVTAFMGLAPVLQASGAAPAESLQAGGQRVGGISRRSRGSRNVLIAFEVAMTALLLSAAGVMLRSFQQLRSVDPGFRSGNLVTMKIALPDALYPRREQRTMFLQTLLARLNATPGIGIAAATDRLPLSGDRNWGGINIVGRPLLDSAHAPAVEGRAVSANYFQTVGIALLRGRIFTEADEGQDHPVVVINQAMAQKFWPGEDPVGQAIVSPYEPTAPPRRIVGVVSNVKDSALDADSPPEMYGTVGWWNEMNVVLRSGLELNAVVAAVRSHVDALDRSVPVYDARKMDDLLTHSIARQRFEMYLLSLFASIAVALAAIGIYGVLAFVVSCRTQEMGIRLALGATPARAMALVLSQGMKLVVLGLVSGLMASWFVLRLMRDLLFRVSTADPLTFAGVALTLMVVGVLACLLPAKRAMRVDPIVALRSE